MSARKPPRLCNTPQCGRTITRYSTTGYCPDCSHALQSVQRRKHNPQMAEGVEASGDAATITKITDTHVRTLADLIRVCEIDTDAWTIERWVANKWAMGSVGPDGLVVTTPLFQVKAYLRANSPIADTKARIEALVTEAKRRLPALPAVHTKGGTCLIEIALYDAHFGALAWAPETGRDDYDLRIAEARYLEGVSVLLNRTRHFRPERILYPLGHDFFHSDTKRGTTTNGTPLDTDSRYPKMFATGLRVAMQTIERLRRLAPVHVPIISGNHDTLASFHLGAALAARYEGVAGVTIDNAPTLRKYVGYGTTALMLHHGHHGKAADWPLLFATEAAALFGGATVREVHTGHLHQRRLVETHGVRVRIIPALCATDAWHSEQQFVGNAAGGEAYVWDRVEGLIATAHYTVPEGHICAPAESAAA